MRHATSVFVAALALSTATFPTTVTAQVYLVQPVTPASQKQKGFDDVHISKAAIAGQQIRVWEATMINPDCSAEGTMTTQMVDQPQHGQASISDEPIYPSYPLPNPRAACNTRKVPAKQAFYTASAGFRGHDKFVFQNATSNGRIRRIIVDVDVR